MSSFSPSWRDRVIPVGSYCKAHSPSSLTPERAFDLHLNGPYGGKTPPEPIVPKDSMWEFDSVDCPFKGAILEPMREYAIWVEAHHLEKMGGAKLSRKLSPARLLGHVPSGRSWIDDLICVPSDEKFIFRAKLETA